MISAPEKKNFIREFQIFVQNFDKVVTTIDKAGTLTYKQSEFERFNRDIATLPQESQVQIIDHLVEKFLLLKLKQKGFSFDEIKRMNAQIVKNWLLIIQKHESISFKSLYEYSVLQVKELEKKLIDSKLHKDTASLFKAALRAGAFFSILSINSCAIYFSDEKQHFTSSYWTTAIIALSGLDFLIDSRKQ